MEPPDDPRHPLNRFPWQRPASRARKTILHYLDAAERRLDVRPDTLGVVDPVTVRRVLAWLRANVDPGPV